MESSELLTTKTPELAAQWQRWVEKNQDEYGHGIIEAISAIGKALDEGRSAKDAERASHGLGITGFMAGMAAQAIAHFHPRGEEYRVWWNQSWGVDEDKARGGTVNPAILTVHDKEAA